MTDRCRKVKVHGQVGPQQLTPLKLIATHFKMRPDLAACICANMPRHCICFLVAEALRYNALHCMRRNDVVFPETFLVLLR